MIKLGIVMDPIASINIKKDTSFAMLLEAQRRGYELHYMEMNDLYLINGAMMLLAAPQSGSVVSGGEPANKSPVEKKLRKNENHKTDKKEDSS